MWQLSGHQALLQRTKTNFHCQTTQPHRGVLGSVLQAVGAAPVNLFRVARRTGEPSMHLIEAYERGTDLVACYEPTPPDEVQPTIYWRACSDATTAAEGLELVLSMQTNLLHSDPLVSVSSELPPGKLFALEANQNWKQLNTPVCSAARGDLGVFLLRPHSGNWSYLEMVFPADFIATESIAATNGGIAWSQLLFGETLEKGVLRRSRVAGWFLRRADDLTTAVRLWQSFCESPPPLTV